MDGNTVNLQEAPPSSGAASLALNVHCAVRGPAFQYGSAVGFEWTRLDLPVEGLPRALDGFRILHLTDLHTRANWDPAFDELIARVGQSPPDMLLFTGDFVDSKRDHRPALPIVKKLMSSLKSRLGTFAILGNHDGDLLGPPLVGWNVTLIDHRRLYLESGDAAVELIGLPGVEREDLDMNWVRSLGTKKAGTLRIALSHYPDALRKVAGMAPDLFLAGHTHGGQVALPNRLPLIRHDSLPRRLCSGIHRAFGTVLVSNRGFGFSSRMMLRLFCPAEVVEVVVRRTMLSETNEPNGTEG